MKGALQIKFEHYVVQISSTVTAVCLWVQLRIIRLNAKKNEEIEKHPERIRCTDWLKMAQPRGCRVIMAAVKTTGGVGSDDPAVQARPNTQQEAD